MAGIATLLRALVRRGPLVVVLGVAVAVTAPAPASAEMQSVQLGPHLCETTGGGRFVPIPDFPGEEIDRRLLPDIAWMEQRFDIFITDGYSTDPIHAENGEHPIGLATDIVPNEADGGTWTKIGHLAQLAEPKQNEPIPPWRWVGWNGDPGHGRGNHLHLSWMHSPSTPRHPARVVYTRICPEPTGDPGQRPGGHSGGRRGGHRRPTGGTRPSRHGGSSSGGVSPGGGTSPAKLAPNLAPAVPSDY